MENKEQDFINRYKDVQESIVKAIDKAVFRAGRGGQWVHYFVALVRESKGDHRGGGDEEMS